MHSALVYFFLHIFDSILHGEFGYMHRQAHTRSTTLFQFVTAISAYESYIHFSNNSINTHKVTQLQHFTYSSGFFELCRIFVGKPFSCVEHKQNTVSNLNDIAIRSA